MYYCDHILATSYPDRFFLSNYVNSENPFLSMNRINTRAGTPVETQYQNQSQTAHERVYDALCDAILAGEFVPGVSVTLRGIADKLGVSPTPVREAIRRLAAEGALEILENRRVCVASMSSARLSEIYQARLALEPELALAAMPQISKQDIKQLQRLDNELNQSLKSGDVATYIARNRQFHFGIYKRANSPVIFPLVRSLWLQFAPFTRIVFGRVGTEYIQDFHVDALSALRQQDGMQFKQAIESDIREGMDLLAEHLQRDA